ncbi:hypothetical protein [Nonomuraea rosea]|uniref:hypothetical protein n=1 Tax=Nonomuraea rosea TaxID=638574 RepID=UPI0031F136C9
MRTPEEEDLAAGRIYTSDVDLLSGEITRRDDLTHMALGIWYQHTGSTYTATIRTAALDVARGTADASERLDQAVTRARTAGVSWSFIGAATGMSHQSARARWSRTIPGHEPGVGRTAAHEALVTPQRAAQINEILTTWDCLQRTAPDRGQSVRFLADGAGMRRRDVDELRRVRNRLAHPADGPVPDQEFRRALRTIRELWRRLGTA